MNNIFLQVLLIAILGVAFCDNDFVNVMAAEKAISVKMDISTAGKELVERIRAGNISELRKFNGEYIKRKYVEKGLDPSVLLTNYEANKELYQHTEKAKKIIEKAISSADSLPILWTIMEGFDIPFCDVYEIAKDSACDDLKFKLCLSVLSEGIVLFEKSLEERDDADLLKTVLVDNADVLQKLVASKEINEIDAVLLMQVSAVAGAVKCFKYLINYGLELDEGRNKIFNAAMAGGNRDIIDICEQKGLRIDTFACFKYAKPDLVEWYLSNHDFDERTFAQYVGQRGGLNLLLSCNGKKALDFQKNDEHKKWALLCASRNGSLGLVKYLVEKCKASVEATDIFGQTPLIIASFGGNLEFVKYLVEKGKANANTADSLGYTPLMIASWNGHLDLVKYLVEKCKANVDAANNSGDTPLILASRSGNIELVKYLVEKGKANLDVANNSGETPLILASGSGNIELVKYLVEKGKANVDAANNSGDTPLILASGSGNIELVKYLVEKCGANADAANNSGDTPLILASGAGNLDLVKYLVEKGKAHVDAANNSGETPLIIASGAGNLDLVKYLVEKCGANANAANNSGATPLILASGAGNIELVEYLVEKCGASADEKDNDGYTALLYASNWGNLDIVKYLVEKCGVKIDNEDIERAKTEKIKNYLKSKNEASNN